MLGAYFPYWMLCTFIGLLGAFCLRVLLIYWGIDDKLPVPLLFYFCDYVINFFNYLLTLFYLLNYG